MVQSSEGMVGEACMEGSEPPLCPTLAQGGATVVATPAYSVRWLQVVADSPLADFRGGVSSRRTGPSAGVGGQVAAAVSWFLGKALSQLSEPISLLSGVGWGGLGKASARRGLVLAIGHEVKVPDRDEAWEGSLSGTLWPFQHLRLTLAQL